jgi:hypothetical protein
MIWSGHDIVWGILRCHVVHDFQHFVIVPLRHLSADVYLRDISTSVSLIPFGSILSSAFSREIYIRNTRTSTIPNSVRRRWGFLIRKPPEGMEIRQCFPKTAWNEKDNILQGKDDDSRPSSWHASLELNFSLATKSGQHAKYMIFVALGCRHEDTAKPPKAWCHINDAIWRQGAMSLEAFHAMVPSKSGQNEVRRFRAGEVTRTDLSLKVSITSAKVLAQDIFIIDFQYAELQDHFSTTARSSNGQLLPPTTSYFSPPMYNVPDLTVSGI